MSYAIAPEPSGISDTGDNVALLAALKAEDDLASAYVRTELEASFAESTARYNGDEYGDEVDGRSRVCTREGFETIEWLRPDLVRAFAAGGRIVEVEATRPEYDHDADMKADYLNYLFFEESEGARLLDAFIFDGLLHRRGFLAVYRREADYSAPENLYGLNVQQMGQLQGDQRVTIEEVSGREGQPSQTHPDGMSYDVKVRRLKRPEWFEIVGVAPEDMRISPRAVSLETARYRGRVIRMLRGEAQKNWPDKVNEIEAVGASSFVDDAARSARFGDESGRALTYANEQAEEVIVSEDYIRFDADGDGYPELIRAYRLRDDPDCLLESEEVEDDPFGSWCPIPMPHAFWGKSVMDIMGDQQRVKTVATRAALDAMYQAVIPRRAINQHIVNLDDLLDVSPGAIIKVDGNPAGAIVADIVPDLAPSALRMIEYIDQVSESRTGVTRHGQGLNPDSLNKTATGIELIQNAAGIRKEMYARHLAVGLEQVFRKLYKMVCQSEQGERAVKIAGQWQRINPSEWDHDAKVKIHVGLGTGSRQAQVAALQLIGSLQEKIMLGMGPQNPMVTPQHLYATGREIIRAIGYQSPDQFVASPPEGWQPQPPTDPNAAKVQADMQIAQMKAQADMQLAQMESKAAMDQTRLQAEKDIQTSQAQQQDDQRRADIDAQDKAQKHELALLIAEREGLNAERAHELALVKLDIEREKLRLMEQENDRSHQENMAGTGKPVDRNDVAVSKAMEALSAGVGNTKAVATGIAELAKAVAAMTAAAKAPKTVKKNSDGSRTVTAG